jgi:hypothetical protein
MGSDFKYNKPINNIGKYMSKDVNPLISRLLKNSPTKNSSVLSDSIFFKDKDIIPTDLPILNIAFSGSPVGGLSSGLTVFAGQSRSFKSLLGLFCMKAYLDKYHDGVGILYDSEGGITPEYLNANGIDPSRVIHIPIEHLEMLKFDMVKTLKEVDRKDHVFMMIDSLGNTASLKELEDAENEKTVAEMQRAKTMKGLFRMVTPSLIAKDVPCVAIAHTYKEMGCLSGDTLIRTANGNEYIKNIKEGCLVYTNNGIQRVDHIFTPEDLQKEDKIFLEIELDDGSYIHCTGNHQFLMSDRTWKSAENFRIGDGFL